MNLASFRVVIEDVEPLVYSIVDHQARNFKLDKTNSIGRGKILVPNANKHFLAVTFNFKLELLVPFRELTTIVVGFGLQLFLVVSEGNVGTHISHHLSVSGQLGLDALHV